MIALSCALACVAPQVEPPGESDTDDPSAGDTTAPTTGATEDDPCAGPEDCHACEPIEPVQVLNRCTDAMCQRFANTPERLPLLQPDGALPPVP
jgi:hypothetical protein